MEVCRYNLLQLFKPSLWNGQLLIGSLALIPLAPVHGNKKRPAIFHNSFENENHLLLERPFHILLQIILISFSFLYFPSFGGSHSFHLLNFRFELNFHIPAQVFSSSLPNFSETLPLTLFFFAVPFAFPAPQWAQLSFRTLEEKLCHNRRRISTIVRPLRTNRSPSI